MFSILQKKKDRQIRSVVSEKKEPEFEMYLDFAKYLQSISVPTKLPKKQSNYMDICE